MAPNSSFAKRPRVLAHLKRHPEATDEELMTRFGISKAYAYNLRSGKYDEHKAAERARGKAEREFPDLTKIQPVSGPLVSGRRNPLEIAGEEIPDLNPGTMEWQGRRRNLDEIMQETNRRRLARGERQVDYSPNWVVRP